MRTLWDAGLAILILSLDSADAAVHGRNRGAAGLHERVLAIIGPALDLGVMPVVNTVATADKLESGELERIRRLVVGHRAILNLTMPTAMGRWAASLDVRLDEARQRAAEELLRRPGVRTDTMSAHGAPGCPAGTEQLNVTPTGDGRLCPLVEGSWGNVRREPLAAIWSSSYEAARPMRARRFCPAADPAASLPGPP